MGLLWWIIVGMVTIYLAQARHLGSRCETVKR